MTTVVMVGLPASGTDGQNVSRAGLKPGSPNLIQLNRANIAPAQKEALLSHYVECLARVSNGVEQLHRIVKRLLDIGVHWKTLYERAEKAGYDSRYVRTLVSKILIDAGVRRHKRGAGPKTTQEALVIEAQARERYDSRASKLLLAAYRVAKAKDLAACEEAPAYLVTR